MNEPIKSGDECVVIGGALEGKGPNHGKRVIVEHLRGEHSVYGRIWRCRAKEGELVTEYGAVGERADFAQSWLQKAPPQAPKVTSTEREVTA